jgi:hypothetical protein
MLIARAVFAGILLFLGHELNFLFAGGLGALIGFRLTPLLPDQWPGWTYYAFLMSLAVIAAAVPIINQRVGYFFSGFLAGGYFLIEFYAPGLLTVPLLPFIIGGVIGSLIIGLFTDWALIVVSCLAGAYYVTDLFTLSPTAETLVSAGLFIVGALTQVIILRMQKQSD